MTREEAIDILKHNYPSSCYEDLCEAVEIAIKSLSAEPEPSQAARDIATIIENEQDMRVMLSQPEIIRCGECKHRDKRYLCDVWDEYITNDYYYCGSADRREE